MPLIKIVRCNWQQSLKEFQLRSNWAWVEKSLRKIISLKKMMQEKTYYKLNENASLVKVSKITAALDMNQYVIASNIGKYNLRRE